MKKLFEDYGKWPVDPVKAREDLEMVKISRDDWKHLIHGEKKHVHVSVLLSTDYAQVGHIRLAPGLYSELENHRGDEVIYMLEGQDGRSRCNHRRSGS